MPNDAKLGLVVGVALVLAVAVVFFRKDASGNEPADTNVQATPSGAAPVRPTRAQAMGRSQDSSEAEAAARKHTVREGETLFSLAQRYYGDGSHFKLIAGANHHDAAPTDPLTPGAVLVIPQMPGSDSSPDEP